MLTSISRSTPTMQKPFQAMLRTIPFGSIVLVLLGGLASGQTLVPSARSIFPSSTDLNNKQHMSPNGKPCLAFEGFTKAQAINTNIFEHWVGVANSCGQQIKVQVCYYKTQDCIAMSVPPFGK